MAGEDFLHETSPAISEKQFLDQLSESLDLIGHLDSGLDQSVFSNSKITEVADASRVLLHSVSGSLDDDLLSLPDSPFGDDMDFLEVFADLSAQIQQVRHCDAFQSGQVY